ncbi:MAG: universal stress protein [Pseudomonadota bacterium]
MSRVLACIDGSVYADSVADHAAWAAGRLGLPVELLQVLGRREAASSDRSGRIVAGARRRLLEELVTLDAQRAKLVQREARLGLEEAKARVEGAGSADATISLRNGDLLETLAEHERDAALVVVGKRGEAADFATLHLGSNLERIVRASQRPIIVTSRAFRPISKVVIGFDAGPSARKAVEAFATSPLYAGLSVVLVTVSEPSESAQAALDQAASRIGASGHHVETRVLPGKPEEVISALLEEEEIDLLMIGAYGHSRLRSLVIGSTTSALIRSCRVPVAIYR